MTVAIQLKKKIRNRIVWGPQQGSQTLAISCPCNHILYEGTRGPGKSDAQLMFFRKWVGRGYGAYWRGVIFDREYKNLDDLVSKSKRWFSKFRDGAKFNSSKSDYKWVWPTGEELLFRQIKKASDYHNYHGQEFPFIGYNELTKYPTPDLYDSLMSCNRSSFIPEDHSPEDPETGVIDLLPEIPLVVFSTTNPHGPGHHWVKMYFIDPAPPGQVVRKTTNVFNPRTKKREDVTKTQVRIFGSYKENRFLSPEYIAELENIKDPNKRKAWLWGDWDISAGGALDDLWGDHLLLPRFTIPKGWRIDRSFDWGSSKPFSVGWWAEADGEEVELPDGKIFCPPKGSLIRINEWYGGSTPGLNKGIRLSSRRVAKGITKREEAMAREGLILTRVRPGPADNSIRDVVEEDTESIASKMEDEGVYWSKSDKSRGSRINGLELVRERLEASATMEGPGLYFMRHCTASLMLLPKLPRDEENPDDVDTTSEDHLYDDVRYRVLAGGNRLAKAVKVKHPT